MSSKVLLGSLIIMCSVTVAGATSRTPLYRNAEFGISLPVPASAQMCPTPPNDRTHHGATFLLGTRDMNLCKISARNRWISIWAEYNSAEETKTLHSFLEWQCEHEAEGHRQSAPEGLRITGMSSEAARVDRPDGSIEVLVVVQAGKPDPNFDASVPANNYELSLHTDSKSFDRDLVVFKEVLNTIKISDQSH